MTIPELEKISPADCECGRVHVHQIDDIIIGCGAIERIPEIVRRYGAKPFVLCDKNTYEAAAKRVCKLLCVNEIKFSLFILDEDKPEPDEMRVGAVVMNYDASCDVVIAVGSGVINDIGKLLASTVRRPYIIAATAPSMDGYASATSSMTRDGLKISLPTKCANVIIGDTDVLSAAPMRMLVSGLGDMLAKYVSICEWRISHIVTGEYYCENMARLIRNALKKCVDNASGLTRREPDAVRAVFEGLVIGGVAMTLAGVSRPASGVEHYLSHIWDMRGVEFGTPVDFHGIQCAIGTLIAVRYYERLKNIRPDSEWAVAYVNGFDLEDWQRQLIGFLGKGAESMIKLDKTEQKYDLAAHKKRLSAIMSNWDEVVSIIDEELVRSDELEALLDSVGAPKSMCEIGLDESELKISFAATKDIRDKYVLSRLLWDLGMIDDFT